MPILYSVIARGTTVLAKYAAYIGNFQEVTDQILSKITLTNEKLTYAHSDYLINYICDNKVVYMCITDKDFERTHSFLFLEDIQRTFVQTYGLQIATAIAYGMNTEFSKELAQQMQYFSSSSEIDRMAQVSGKIKEVTSIVVTSIDLLRDRGVKLDLLVNKTESITNNSIAFRKGTRNLAREMFWKNIRVYVAGGLVLIFLIYIVISMFCGGLTWERCLA